MNPEYEKKFIYKPTETAVNALGTLCGLCWMPLIEYKSCPDEECIKLNKEREKDRSTLRCLEHGCELSECMKGTECRAVQNIKKIVMGNKGRQ